MTDAPKVRRECKRDVFGRVELLDVPGGQRARRLACGNGWPGTGLLARWLLRRERRALAALAGCPGVPQLVADAAAEALPAIDGRQVPPTAMLLRTWLAGEPLWAVQALPVDFFARLRELVAALHARGVCHNDLHKENNILVDPAGWPAVIDFQLASLHPHGGRAFRLRAAEDLRHVDKHAARYRQQGAPSSPSPPAARSLPARWWRAVGKPVYNLVTRRWLGLSRGEPRRPRGGPWPQPTAPLGPWPQLSRGAVPPPADGHGSPRR